MTIEEMKSEAMKQKMEEGPRGVLTVFPSHKHGNELLWTFLFFWASVSASPISQP